MKNINPCHTKSWNLLQQHFEIMKNVQISDLFAHDDRRFSSFSISFKDQMLVDYSKNRINYDTISKLVTLAEECYLKNAIVSMFNGEKINRTEKRAVLHIALRNCTNTPIMVDGKNVMIEVNSMLLKIKNFCSSVINGIWKGYTGKSITDIVNIGIGGSYLGPYMVTEALRAYKNHLNIHFVSNIDGTDIIETIKKLNPETTLFLIASKNFTTQETIVNAQSARNWFLQITHNKKYFIHHFVAISNNIKKALEFGVNIENIFEIWDWVGGRYSLWSAMGLSIALSIGFDNFKKLLHGAHSMDQHFLNTPFNKNIPVILGLISIWYNNFFNLETEAILPYDQYMHHFAAYLQQGNMESNGKSIDRNGKRVDYQTGPIIWGEHGTNGQHSFYQLIHQGTKIIPCDFIAPVISHNPLEDHHIKLLANFFAQTEALAFGSKYKIKKTTNSDNKILHSLDKLPFKILDGNRPSNSILLRKITPYNLGFLIALYEHKIFTQGVIFNIYSFDQWGVELGKDLADNIVQELIYDKTTTNKYSVSTNGLIKFFQKWKCI